MFRGAWVLYKCSQFVNIQYCFCLRHSRNGLMPLLLNVDCGSASMLRSGNNPSEACTQQYVQTVTLQGLPFDVVCVISISVLMDRLSFRRFLCIVVILQICLSLRAFHLYLYDSVFDSSLIQAQNMGLLYLCDCCLFYMTAIAQISQITMIASDSLYHYYVSFIFESCSRHALRDCLLNYSFLFIMEMSLQLRFLLRLYAQSFSFSQYTTRFGFACTGLYL